MNQDGNYTKHYYADATRIASKIGSGFSQNLCDGIDEILNGIEPSYLDERKDKQHDEMMEELTELINGNQITDIHPRPFPHPHFYHTGGGGHEADLFFYHPDHLGSIGMVTDNNASITQGFLYAPFGEIMTEYNPGWQNGVIPKYSFNAKELDEENGMYYYSARYYDPKGTFISRDPMFEKYFWISPYVYCSNNPVKYVDPTGMEMLAIDGDPPSLYAPQNTKSNIAIKIPYAIPNTDAKTESKTSPPKQNETTTPQTTSMLDYYKKEFKNTETWEKKVEYGLKTAGEFVGFDEKKAIDAVAPIAQGAVLLIPLVGVPNGIYTAVAGEDIYGNEASTANRIISGAGVVAGGVDKFASGVASTTAKIINKVADAYTMIQTTREGYKKQNNNENKKK